jgi:serine/threonine-protein kinase
MGAARTCPQCHATLPDDAPDGPGPRCSYGVVMGASSTEETADAPAPIGAAATVTHTPQGPARLGHDETTLDVPPGKVGPTPATSDTPARYELGEEVARGGMGAVLRARDAALGRELAVKVLLDRHRGRPEVLRRFVEEARIGGQLQHPGVVPVYDLGTLPDARPFFAMKLVEGRTLAALLAERADPIADLPRFLSIFEAVCQAMAYAHARGVIHRDLKPSNVMVGAFGEVQVMDWGLAKVLRADNATSDETERAIRAARLAGRDESVAGDVLGTPAYMAPEQARGEVDRVDRRADVFGLGGILAAVLTGGPTFRASSSSAALDLARAGDTADVLARLGACGADAELVALARDCLAAEPEGRPADAGIVAARMTEYLSGVQERLRRAELARVEAQARAEEEAKRAAVERQRRRLTVGLAASLLALTTVGGLAFTYARQQELARAARVDRLLAEARLLRNQARERPEDVARWEKAREVLGRAAEELGPSAEAPLAEMRREVEAGLGAAEADRDLLARLVDIRSAQADDLDGWSTDAAYAAAFATAGIDPDGGPATEVGALVARRPEPVARAVVTALDHWAEVRRQRDAKGPSWARLLAVARAADPDPDRDALRAALLIADRSEWPRRLLPLVERADAQTWAPASLVLLGDVLAGVGDVGAGVAVLRRASAAQPADAPIHFALGRLLQGTGPPQPEEAIRAYSVARALQPELAGHALAHALEDRGRGAEAEAIWRDLVRRRPDHGGHLACFACNLKDRGLRAEAAAVFDRAIAASREAVRRAPDQVVSYNALGLALKDRGRPGEAVEAIREAVRLRPDYAKAHCNLGLALMDQGKPDEAVVALREAVRLAPDDAVGQSCLGLALIEQRRPDEAVDAFREALRLRPDYAKAHCGLGVALANQGKFDEAVDAFREAVRLRPDYAVAHYDLGHALADQRRPGEAVDAFREALRLDPDYPGAYNDLGLALLDLGKLDEAVEALREAVRRQPERANAHTNLGLALMSLGKPHEAVEVLRGAIRLAPDYAEAHCNLGLALQRAGDHAGALAELRTGHELGSKRPDWRYPSAQWVAQAERLATLADRLPAVLGGQVEPADVAERLAFAKMAYDTRRYAGAARLWGEALGSDPKLADSRNPQHRYNAACAAALAASGQGIDDPAPDDATRPKLRQQALAWLKAELVVWTRFVESGPPQARAFVAQTLEHWEKDTDLVGVRGPDALGKLPEAERDAWRALWGEVAMLLDKAKSGG